MAVPLYVSALAIFEKTLGPEHPQVRTRARLRARGLRLRGSLPRGRTAGRTRVRMPCACVGTSVCVHGNIGAHVHACKARIRMHLSTVGVS